MKKIITVLILTCSCNLFSQLYPSVYSYTAADIDGNTIPLGQFYGKKTMFVNTASFCGYTYQYTDLEKLYQQYKSKNFEIIAFPCNDFGGQDPYGDSTIHQFCSTYSISFALMSKIKIKVGDTAGVYKWLQRSNLNGVNTISVDWNFNKFLIDEQGHWVRHFTSAVNPLDTAITNWIMKPSSIRTGVYNLESETNFVKVISPNPVQKYIDMEFSSSSSITQIELRSIEGKLIYSASSNLSHTSIDVSNFESGIYFLLIRNNGLSRVEKVIVER